MLFVKNLTLAVLKGFAINTLLTVTDSTCTESKLHSLKQFDLYLYILSSVGGFQSCVRRNRRWSQQN